MRNASDAQRKTRSKRWNWITQPENYQDDELEREIQVSMNSGNKFNQAEENEIKK